MLLPWILLCVFLLNCYNQATMLQESTINMYTSSDVMAFSTIKLEFQQSTKRRFTALHLIMILGTLWEKKAGQYVKKLMMTICTDTQFSHLQLIFLFSFISLIVPLQIIYPYYRTDWNIILQTPENHFVYQNIPPIVRLKKFCWYKLWVYPISNGSIHKINISLGKHYKYRPILYWIEIGLNAKDLTLIHNPSYAKFLVFVFIQWHSVRNSYRHISFNFTGCVLWIRGI